jgi:hypothetical protein
MCSARISARERCSARVWQRVHQGAKAEAPRRKDFLYWLKRAFGANSAGPRDGDPALRHWRAYLSARPEAGTLIGALMGPVSYVSCVSWMCSVNADETHETFHQESGMRYQ